MKRQGEVVVDLAEQIKLAIQQGEFAPDELLRESAIISKFGSSRTSAREALRLLVSSGLVVKSPNRSYRVSNFTERDLYELGTLRLQLEQLAAKLAFDQPAFAKGMATALDEMRDAVRRRDKIGAFDANNRFHEAIIQSADHRRLAEAYGGIADQIEFAFLTSGRLDRDIDHLVGEHEILLDLAMNGQIDAFLKELQRHVQGGLQGATGLVIPDISMSSQADVAQQQRSGPEAATPQGLKDADHLGW